MKDLQPVRGTKDLIGEEYQRHAHVVDVARHAALCYGFEPVATPIFEFTEVFSRTLGETSDVVNKEMYIFEDRGGHSLTLRPEFTAAMVRAVISGGLTQDLPLKWFSHGPIFRYDRPQKGRMRQFHQINIEHIGAQLPEHDADVIALAALMLERLGVLKHTTLHLNSIGDMDSRNRYREALVTYFSKYKNDLSEDSLRRLESNPLRILDSKDEGDKKLVADAPTITAHYNDETKAFWDKLRHALTDLKINYHHNPHLVRGLDYYCHTAFEFVTEALGAQGTVLGGGRYDGLMKQMGGPETPAIGFAGGIERLSLMMETAPESLRPIVLIPMGEEATRRGLQIAQNLREADWAIDLILSGNMGKRMKRANKRNARLILILGEDELKANEITIKDFDAGDEKRISIEHITHALASYKECQMRRQ